MPKRKIEKSRRGKTSRGKSSRAKASGVKASRRKASRSKSSRSESSRSKALRRPKPDAIGLALAGLAHDIRTPLTGMLAMSELLLASTLPERERGWAAAMKDAAGHLARLTTIVVDAAKAGSAGLVLTPETFTLREFIDAVIQSLKARAQSKALDVKVSVTGELPGRVSADAVRLRSALENLIDNAVKFTERGRISMAVTSAAASRSRVKLTFTVADTGIGIVAADLKRLFKPFAQANESVTRRFGGSGLGLAFARGIAEAMGGSLTVTSKPGQGSTFRLMVLVDQAEPERVSAAGVSRALPALRILCVEDNPYGRVVLNTVLGELGHDVSFAETGEVAVETVKGGSYDVVLLDVALPGIDGFETARRIRALPGAAGSTPIIGVSGRTENSDEEAAWDAGMDTYLRKPASPASLNEALTAAIAPERTRRPS